MKEVKVPSPGESISEVEIAQWLVKDGDYVEVDQAIAEMDSDKATLELPAEDAGIIKIKVEAGEAVAVGSVIAEIDETAKAPAKKETAAKVEAAPAVEEKAPNPNPAPALKPTPAPVQNGNSYADNIPSVAAKKIMEENGIAAQQLNGTGKAGRITKQDVLAAMAGGINTAAASGWGGTRNETSEKMSMLRRKVAQRLVSVKNETAMLTTFNEADMKPIMDIRKQYKEKFKEAHGVSLGFMSFFTKAVCEALHLFPAVNSYIDGENMLSHDYADVGIAVSTPKGLMVPILRNAEKMSLAGIELGIKELAIRARDGKLSIDDMTGGTFTITNGGVFGSMMSTPIINPPQSAILGMHNIIERPVAINGQVEIRPMMYLALSYDHRIVDGAESVSFLVKVKEMLEHPERIIFGGKSAEEVLLNL